MRADPLLQNLLRETSRSFYLTLRVLPAAIRTQIGLAYLLARTTDTIADTGLVPPGKRLKALEELRARIAGESAAGLDFGALALSQASPAERTLLERCEESLKLLNELPGEDQTRVRAVLATIIGGQKLDLERFGGVNPPEISALKTDAELDDYTYRVAGCVGEFWTRVCLAHLFPRARVNDAAFLRDGIRFGKGLQLVNILRDIPKDLGNGRCYVPLESLASAGLAPSDLLLTGNEPRFRPLYQSLLERATAHLRAGWDYTNALPAGQIRLRLACAWPVLIGAATLNKLGRENVLDATQRIKVERADVRGMMARSVLWLAWPGGWAGQFDRALARRK